jgi:branched-chain amino acid transport system substrate-binding protein
MDKKYLLSLLATGVLLVMAGCTGATTDTNGTEETGEIETIVIGGMGPLTGDAASYGVEFQRLAEMGVADVNIAWADKGMELDIQWEDGACNGKDASTAAQKLIDVNGAEIIIGGFCSSETLAAAAITNPAGVVLLSPASSSPDVTDAGEYVWRNWPSDAFQGTKLAQLATDMGYETIAILSEVQDYTAGIARVFTSAFEANGGTIVEETYLSEDTDVKTQLTKLKEVGVDGWLINPQTPVKADLILKQMNEMNIEGPFLLNDVAGVSVEILADHGDYLEGSYTATVYIDTESDDVLQVQNGYFELYGEEMNFLAYDVTAYDAVHILAEAIEAVGNDAAAVNEYLSTMSYSGLTGTMSFDENGDPLTGHAIFKIEGGEIVVQ